MVEYRWGDNLCFDLAKKYLMQEGVHLTEENWVDLGIHIHKAIRSWILLKEYEERELLPVHRSTQK